LYVSTGAYTRAQPLYHRALSIIEKVLGPEHPDTASTLANLATLYFYTGAHEQAGPLLNRALAIREKVQGPDHPDTALVIEILSILHWSSGNMAKTRSLKLRAQAIREKNLAMFFLTGSESRKQAYIGQLRSKISANISFSLLMNDHQARALGFLSVLTTKGRILDTMSDSAVRLRASVKPEDRAIVEELITVAQQRSTLIYQGSSILKPEIYQQRLQELATRQEQLETKLSTRSAEFRQQIAPISVASVQAVIPKGATLVEWYRYEPFDPKAKDHRSQWGQPRYVAYVVVHEGASVIVDVGEAGPIDQLVHDFRAGLSDPTITYIKDHCCPR
ncbi:MAG: tetratricopeptide repeat protein, partial [Nitrospira sp.]